MNPVFAAVGEAVECGSMRVWGKKLIHSGPGEVQAAGVDTMGTACPYCLTMLDDGIKSLEVEDPPEVWDIIEVVASSMECKQRGRGDKKYRN